MILGFEVTAAAIATVVAAVVGAAAGIGASWWASRRTSKRDKRTAARLLEDELIEIAVRMEWLLQLFKTHWEYGQIELQAIEEFYAQSEFASEEDHEKDRMKTQMKTSRRIGAVWRQLPTELPEELERWTKYGPTLATEVDDVQWDALRQAYTTIATIRLLPTLFERDLGESRFAGTAMSRLFDDLQEKVERALDVLAWVADDRESGWPATRELVTRYYKSVELGRPLDLRDVDEDEDDDQDEEARRVLAEIRAEIEDETLDAEAEGPEKAPPEPAEDLRPDPKSGEIR